MAIEGERKLVTVLFADMKASMELMARRDAEDARKVLDSVLERMIEAVHRYEGTVNQIMGDGIMALFGAPLAQEDHAVRACYAALQMQVAVKRYANAVRGSEDLPPEIRVGLNSGEVVVRSICSDLHMDYTAVGQTTHLASRMEQLAKPGSILISTETWRLAEGYVEVRSLGATSIKGLLDPIEVFEVIGPGPRRSRLHAAVTHGLGRFVGRDAEMTQLGLALHRVQSGHGQVVAVVGDPGVGKSRLLYEFAHSELTRGWRRLTSLSSSYGKASAYLPVVGLLRRYFGIETDDDRRVIADKVSAQAMRLTEALKSSLPSLLSLLEALPPDSEFLTLDAPLRRRRILEAVERLLLCESQIQPLLLVFEDLHWIDSETQQLLDDLVASLPASRILLLVSYRREYQHTWAGKTFYTQLNLQALLPAAANELLETVLGNAAELDPFKRFLIEKTQGNPFFLEETIRALVETNVLVGKPGAYRTTRVLEDTRVPATVQAVLAARIDRLPPAEKHVLQSAAVIGKDFSLAILTAIADMDEYALRQALASLQAAEFLYKTQVLPDPAYTFRHALTHEVVYEGILHERRRRLHAKIFDRLQQIEDATRADGVERLAHHAARGAVWDQAALYLRQAGTRAFAQGAYRLSVEWFEQALDSVKHLPQTPETLEQALDLWLEMRYALSALGRFDSVLDCLRKAEALALSLGDKRRLALISSFLANYYQVLGDLESAVDQGERARLISISRQDLAPRIVANSYLALAYQTLGDYRRGADRARENIATLTGDLVGERFGMTALPSVYSRTALVRALAEMGEFSEATAVAEEAIGIAERFHHAYSLMFACLGRGIAELRQGEHDRAISSLERSLGVARSGEEPALVHLVAGFLGSAYAITGRAGAAVAILEEALAQLRALRSGCAPTLAHAVALAGLAEAELAADRIEAAGNIASRALDAFMSLKARGYRAWTVRLLGKIDAGRSGAPTPEAEARYREALVIAEELGMQPLAAQCHLDLGALYRRAGDPARARGELLLARDLFDSLDMSFWLECAEQAIARLG